MKKFIAVFTLLFVASLSLSADVYIKTKNHRDAMSMMGQNTPANDSVSEQWLGDDVFANVFGWNLPALLRTLQVLVFVLPPLVALLTYAVFRRRARRWPATVR